MTDTDIARTIFANTQVNWRLHDVQTTETYARDVEHYRPRDNDWPGVDDAGSNAEVKRWEHTPGAYLPSIPKKSIDQRQVLGYVNWYGKDNTRTLEPEPRRTWSLDSHQSGNYFILDLEVDSRLYRSEPETIDMNSLVTTKSRWFTTRQQAVAYNNVDYVTNQTEKKAIFPFVVGRSVPLMDMNDGRNIFNMRRQIHYLQSQTKDPKLIDKLDQAADDIKYAFPVDQDTGIVGRKSHVKVDNRFCDWFVDQYVPQFAGWIYMWTEEARNHHDEIFIAAPSHYLYRDNYVVREVRWEREQTTVDDDDDDQPLQDSV